MLPGLPGDPVILLGVVNTKLRDFYPSLDAMCDDMQIEKEELTEKLGMIDYEYDDCIASGWHKVEMYVKIESRTDGSYFLYVMYG